MQLSPDLLTVSSPMGANVASHEEQYYLWASFSEGYLLSWTDFKVRFVSLPIAIFPLSNQLCDCWQFVVRLQDSSQHSS